MLKNPRLIDDSKPIVLFRSSFDLRCFNPSPISKNKKKIVENESNINKQQKCLLDKIEFPQLREPLKKSNINMQSKKEKSTKSCFSSS